MILINLLPHREAARKRQKKRFYNYLAWSIFIGVALIGLAYLWYQRAIESQEQRNLYLQQEIAKLDIEIKDIATLQSQIKALRARQTAVENLQGDRNLPVYLLDELVTQLPDGVYLSSMKQENENILLTGMAQSQERVSELLRNLGGSKRLSRPELVEIVASTVAGPTREQRRVSNFTIRVVLARPATEKADALSGGPAVPTVPSGKV